jgi:hypothetical protein
MWTRALVLLPLIGCAELESLLEDATEAAEAGGVCAAEAYRGDIFGDSALDNAFELIGSFEDMVFRADTQTFTADIAMSRLGLDVADNIVTDCDYTGVAEGIIDGVSAAGATFRGVAVVTSAWPDREGCLAEPQPVEINLVVPFACDTVEGEWVHDADDSYGTGQGHLSVTEVYLRSDIDADPGEEIPDDEPDDTDTDTHEEDPDDEVRVNAQDCPLDTDMYFVGPLSGENGCEATLHTVNSIDDTGHLTGEMWLSHMNGSCDLVEADMDAWVSEDGMVTGTVSGQVVAYAGVQIVDGCQEMVDGWFRIEEWDDRDLATYSLQRVK